MITLAEDDRNDLQRVQKALGGRLDSVGRDYCIVSINKCV